MSLSEHPSIEGVLTLELRDQDGALLERRVVHNLITNSGKGLLARLLGGKTNGAVALSIGVGKVATAAAPGDDRLGEQLAAAKADMSDPIIGVAGVKVTVKATIVDGGKIDQPLPLTEAGILVKVGEGPDVLFNRVTFPVINKGPNISLLLSWDLTF